MINVIYNFLKGPRNLDEFVERVEAKNLGAYLYILREREVGNRAKYIMELRTEGFIQID